LGVIQSLHAIEEATMNVSGSTGPLGRPRGIGFGILLYIVTLGFYGWYWVYKTEEEMKQHTGNGIGGVLALVIWILLSPVMAFVIPSEIHNMYAKDGQQPPVSGWTGFWLFPFGVFIIPAIVWFVKVQGALNRYWEGRAPEGAVTAPA
jgi:Na+/proline symporter